MPAAAQRLPVAFRPRAGPLAPLAVAARGEAAAAIAERLLARDDAALAKLSGVTAAGVILIAGEAEALPWADGVLYLGRDPAAPSLLLPTALEPDVPAPLFERAVLARAASLIAPVAVLVDPPALLSAGSARPVERRLLAAFLRAAREASS